jgi:hypothetical protein
MVMPAPQAQQQAAPQQAQPQGGDEQAKGQAQFEALAGPMLEYVTGKGLPDVQNSLKAGANDPESAIGNTVGQILATKTNEAMDAGKKIPPGVMTATAMELINTVTDIGVDVGVVPKEQRNEIGEAAFVVAVAVFGELVVPTGAIDEQEKQQYALITQELEELAQMKVQKDNQGGQPQEQPQGQPQAAPQQPQNMGQALGG